MGARFDLMLGKSLNTTLTNTAAPNVTPIGHEEL